MVAAGNLIRATDLNNLAKPYYAASTGSTTWTTGTGNVRQDVAGLTFDVVTINPNALVVVTWVVDVLMVTTVAANNFQFRLEVDGVPQGPLAIFPTTATGRGTCAATMMLTHATPDTYTYKITGLSGSATAGATAGSGLCTMTAIAVDLAA